MSTEHETMPVVNSTHSLVDQYLTSLQNAVDSRYNTFRLDQEQGTFDTRNYDELFNREIDLSNEENVRAAIMGSVYGRTMWDLSTSGDPEDEDLLIALEEHFKGQLDEMEEFIHERHPGSGINRRQMLIGSIGVIGLGITTKALIALGQQPEQVKEPVVQEQGVLHDSSVEASEEGEALHNPDHISRTDHYTAIAVTSAFISILGTQTAAGIVKDGAIPKPMLKVLFGTDEQSKAELSGWTAGLMSSAWIARVMALDLDSKINADPAEREASMHAYKHEMKELENLPVAAALVVASEVTSKIFYEQREELLHKAVEAFDQLASEKGYFEFNGEKVTVEDLKEFIAAGEDSLEEFMNLSDSEVLHKTTEIIAAYIDAQKVRADLEDIESKIESIDIDELDGEIQKLKASVSSDIIRMGSLSTFLAPVSLTFTTASMANGSLKKIALNMAKMQHLEQIRQSKESGTAITEDNLNDYWKKSNDKTKKQMNSMFGLVNLAVTSAANVAGVPFFGDPPNIFFLKDHGMNEWIHNSFEGLAYSASYSLLAYNSYLLKEKLTSVRTLPKANAEAVAASVKNIANTAFSLARPLIQNRFIRIGKGLPPFVQGRLGIDFNSLTEDLFDKAKETVFADAFGEKFSQLSDFLERFGNATDGLDDDDQAKVDFMREQFSNGEVASEETQTEMVDELKEMVDELADDGEDLSGELSDKINAILLKLHSYNRENIMNMGVESIISELMKEIDGFITSDDMKGDFKGKIRTYLLTVIDSTDDENTSSHSAADNEVHDHKKHHALSHSARDVRNALGTQLWAVGSLQVVTKKAMGLDKAGMLTIEKAKEYTNKILGIIAVTSAVADNVAAMLFGIDVLAKIGAKGQGENFDEQSPFAKKLRKYAFMMAVFAGSLSKIGNGPNMSIEKLNEIFWGRDERVMETITMPNALATSFANGWSGIAVGALFLRAKSDLAGEINKFGI